MKLCVVVYSQTGNTHSVGKRLKTRLDKEGHLATVRLLGTADGDAADSQQVQLQGSGTFDHPDQYDAVIFGSPVHAFSLPPVMTDYLNQLPSLEDKAVACFVTKQLPFYWTGGYRAIGKMKNICESKGGRVLGTEIVIYSGSKRDQSINRCVENLSGLFSA